MPDSLIGLTLARPLWLLALVPAAILLVLLHRYGWRRSGWETLLPPQLRPWLLKQHTGGSHAGRFTALGLTWLCAVLALAGPVTEQQAQVQRAENSALVIVLDVSHNMLSHDLKPDRLQRAKHKIQGIMQQQGDNQLALIAFAGSAHRVTPLSRDHTTLGSLLMALEPDIMPQNGQNIDAALTLARQMIAQQPRSSTQVLLITSGLDTNEREALATHAEALGEQLAILGVGTSAGAPVPLAEGGFMRDSQGRILLPRLNSQKLAAVARQHSARYHGITVNDRDINYLLQHLRGAPSVEADARRMLVDHGHWLLLLLLPLAALGARRGWLGLLFLITLLPPQAEALDWADLWQRPDQQAMQLLEQQQPQQAAERFDSPAWRAWALYQAGAYEKAAATWERLAAAEPDNPEYHFNYGTAQAMAGEYQQALEAYEQALTRAPEHHPARHNRDVVETLLEALRQQQAEQQPDGTEQSEAAEAADTPAESQPVNGSQRPQPSKQTAEPVGESETSSPGSTPPSVENSAEAGGGGDNSAASNGSDIEPHASRGAEGMASGQADSDRFEAEQQQALEQWLQDIPDDPAELLRRKFLYQHLQQKGTQR